MRHDPSQGGGGLTRNQELVLARLRAQPVAQSAYALLDELRDEGLRAPTQVYRALEALTARGLVHRIESLNAYVACCHEAHGHDEEGAGPAGTVLAICRECGAVVEFGAGDAGELLAARAGLDGFRAEGLTVELKGLCRACRS